MIETTNKTKVSFCLTDGKVIKGTINVRKYNRLSDYLNSKEADQFIIMVDASIPGQAGKVAIINRNQIIWAAPED